MGLFSSWSLILTTLWTQTSKQYTHIKKSGKILPFLCLTEVKLSVYREIKRIFLGRISIIFILVYLLFPSMYSSCYIDFNIYLPEEMFLIVLWHFQNVILLCKSNNDKVNPQCQGLVVLRSDSVSSLFKKIDSVSDRRDW